MWNEPCVTNSKIYTCTKIHNLWLKVYNFHYRRKILRPSIWQLIDHQKNSLAFCTNIMGWIRYYHSQIILLFLKDSSLKTQVGYIVIYESEVHICVCVCMDACVWMYEGFFWRGCACGWWRCSHSKQSGDIIWLEWETVSMVLASVTFCLLAAV